MSLRGASADAQPKAFATQDLPLDDPEGQLLAHRSTEDVKPQGLPLPLPATIAAALKELPRDARSWWSWRGAVLIVLLFMIILPYFQHSSGETHTPLQSVRKGATASMDWNLHTPAHVASAANGTCWSLQEGHLYYPPPEESPSPALLLALRAYEAMHRDCVGQVSNWANHFEKMEAGREKCKYLVFYDYEGALGDRLGPLLSAFVYALLTHRALLVTTSNNLPGLLCNPFPESSWWLPQDFPVDKLRTAAHQGEYVVQGKSNNAGSQDLGRRDIAAIWLQHWYEAPDSHIFCDYMQSSLEAVTWMGFETNQYIVPALYLVPRYKQRLLELFPSRVVMTFSARYLLHPVNHIWERVTRVFKGYLAQADVRVGVEVRTHSDYDELVGRRIKECMVSKGVLPAAMSGEDWASFVRQPSKAAAKPLLHSKKLAVPPVMALYVSTASSGYFDYFKLVYSERPTADHSIVVVHSEHHAHTKHHSLLPDQKELAELWLLSMSDSLLVSYHSPQGYLASALCGRQAYLLNIVENSKFNDANNWKKNGRPACEKLWTNEGCFHVAPKSLQCNAADSAGSDEPHKWVPFVKKCQDETQGLTVLPPKT